RLFAAAAAQATWLVTGRLGRRLDQLQIDAALTQRLAGLAGGNRLALVEGVGDRAAQVRVDDAGPGVRHHRGSVGGRAVDEAAVEVQGMADGAGLLVGDRLHVLPAPIRPMAERAGELTAALRLCQVRGAGPGLGGLERLGSA